MHCLPVLCSVYLKIEIFEMWMNSVHCVNALRVCLVVKYIVSSGCLCLYAFPLCSCWTCSEVGGQTAEHLIHL